MTDSAPPSQEPAQSGVPQAILTQQEISDLLKDRPEQENEGLRAYLRQLSRQSPGSSRLPVLDIVVDRFVRMLNTTMRNFTGENVDISLDNMYSVRFADLINSLQVPLMIGVVRSASWRGFALFCVEAQLIYSVVDVLLGGRRGGDRSTLEGRMFTSIERRLVRRMLSTMLADLEISFQPVGVPAFVLDGVEINPRFIRLARPDTPVTVAALRFNMEDRGGKILIAFPEPLFHSVRHILGQPFYGDNNDGDIGWGSEINTQTMITSVNVDVILDSVPSTLEDVMSWTIGSVLHLNATKSSPVDLRIGTKSVAKGELGRSGTQIVVRVL